MNEIDVNYKGLFNKRNKYYNKMNIINNKYNHIENEMKFNFINKNRTIDNIFDTSFDNSELNIENTNIDKHKKARIRKNIYIKFLEKKVLNLWDEISFTKKFSNYLIYQIEKSYKNLFFKYQNNFNYIIENIKNNIDENKHDTKDKDLYNTWNNRIVENKYEIINNNFEIMEKLTIPNHFKSYNKIFIENKYSIPNIFIQKYDNEVIINNELLGNMINIKDKIFNRIKSLYDYDKEIMKHIPSHMLEKWYIKYNKTI